MGIFIRACVFLFGPVTFVLLAAGFATAATWDGSKAKQEDVRWKAEIEEWKSIAEEWDQKRQAGHQRLYGDFVDDGIYCTEEGCWEEDMFEFVYTSRDGTGSEVGKSRLGAEWHYGDGAYWESSNVGQSMHFDHLGDMFWESSNFGQSLEFTNNIGDRWESSNFGQSVMFEGADGTEWESSNFGQSLEYTDATGKMWESSNFGQSGTLIDEYGNVWDLDDTR